MASVLGENSFGEEMQRLMEETERKYKDIIDLPRPVSSTHHPMPEEDRAAQFSAFAALTGYGSAIRDAEEKFAVDNADGLEHVPWSEEENP